MVTPRKSRGTASIKKPRATAMDQTSSRPTYEDVARRAYELFVERGATDGRDWEDWLAAERQLSPDS